MSYILEAIRKSDQLRRRGAAPTLPSAPFVEVPEEPTSRWVHATLGFVLVAVAFAIGWTRPWRSEPEPTTPEPIVSSPPRLAPIPPRAVAAPQPAPPVVAKDAVKPVTSSAEPATVPPPPQSDKIVPLAELSPQFRQELPPMKVSVHAYSRTPSDRLVDINDKLLHEGDALAPGLVLEAITPEGMVFNYRGTRFSRGVQ